MQIKNAIDCYTIIYKDIEFVLFLLQLYVIY